MGQVADLLNLNNWSINILNIENPPHQPVLLDEVVKQFATEREGYFIDATLGYGGHSSAILSQSPNLHLIGIDRDITAIQFSTQRLKQ